MSRHRSRRRLGLFAAVAVVILAVCVGAFVMLGRSPLQTAVRPTKLADVTLPAQPLALTWSPDGAYLAGGTWGGLPPFEGAKKDRGAVYLIDVNQKAPVATLDLPNYCRVVAFSPDGKWLAVGTTHPPVPGGQTAAELLVCEVPGLAVKFRARANDATAFLDVGWTADGSALYAIEGTDVMDLGTAVRGWTTAGWAERPAITAPRSGGFGAVAVAPDGKAVAVADRKGIGSFDPVLIRLFDPDTGKQVNEFTAATRALHPRLAFTPDGAAVGVLTDDGVVAWFDRVAGGSTTPANARLALVPAAQADHLVFRAVTPDLTRRAVGSINRTTAIGQGLFGSRDRFGTFVEVTDATTGAATKWRVGDEYGYPPAVVFSPDGSKLATTTGNPGGGAVQVWTVPK